MGKEVKLSNVMDTKVAIVVEYLKTFGEGEPAYFVDSFGQPIKVDFKDLASMGSEYFIANNPIFKYKDDCLKYIELNAILSGHRKDFKIGEENYIIFYDYENDAIKTKLTQFPTFENKYYDRDIVELIRHMQEEFLNLRENAKKHS